MDGYKNVIFSSECSIFFTDYFLQAKLTLKILMFTNLPYFKGEIFTLSVVNSKLACMWTHFYEQCCGLVEDQCIMYIMINVFLHKI